MKNFMNKIKPVLVFLFWATCSCGVIILLGASVKNRSELKFSKINVSVDDANDIQFINVKDVLQMLKDNQLNPTSAKAISDIDYHRLERMIESNPYIEHADIFTDANEKIQINIEQRVPLLRIINNQSVSYYLDVHGMRMPLSPNFTARVPVATGFIFTNAEHQSKADEEIEKKLFVLANNIQQDSFMAALTQQIIVNEQNEFEIIPSIGGSSIEIGDTSELGRKFMQLKIFYRETIGHINLNQYSKINLKYADKVYCTRKGVEARVDSSMIKSRSVNN